MDKYIAQGAGFPADNEFLMLIQSIIGEVAQLSHLGGDNYILKGCEVVAGNAAPGWMVLGGEVVRFAGGALAANVTINEAVENATYLEDLAPADGQGDSKPAYFHRTAVFGNNGDNTIAWESLERVRPLREVQRAVTPVGGIIMYDGPINAIPDGWELYELIRGRKPVGYDPTDDDYDTIGAQGGFKEVALTEAQMPSHNHTGTTNVTGAHNHTTVGYAKQQQSVDNGGGSVVADSVGNSPNTGTAGQHGHTLTINARGGGQPHENRDPYLVVAFIRFTG